jgi:4-hydroxybenzoate polyprenyltransferase
MVNTRPLVLDVDGTFLRTDMLYECFWAGMGKNPIGTLRACISHLGHREVLKRKLADIAGLRTDLLPVNPDVAALARQAQAEGREVILASASDASLVQALAQDHDLSPRIFGSDSGVNLKGVAKAGVLLEAFGEDGFDYAGNEEVDLTIWQHAAGAIIVGNKPDVAKALEKDGKTVTCIPGSDDTWDLIRAMRPHQWVKNFLLLVPMIAAHEFRPEVLLLVLLGMVAFSAAASSIYIVNDLLDLDADRLHATKCDRPFASGAVPIRTGMLLGLFLGILALIIAALLSGAFLAVVAIYMTLSLAYSLRLKRLKWLDIAALAALYSLRVVAGAVAVNVDVSDYLLIFIFPVFFTLGCVKRLTEVTLAADDKLLPGRGYSRLDRGKLLNMAIVSMIFSVSVFVLYSFSEQGIALYPTTWLLWLAAAPLALWLFRMVWLGYAGKQDYDPLLFAMRDKFGLGLLMIMLSIMFYAAGLWQQWFG